MSTCPVCHDMAPTCPVCPTKVEAAELNMGSHEPLKAKYKLTRIEPLANNVMIDTADRVHYGVEIEPSPKKKYIFTVEVGDAPPVEARRILQSVINTLKSFLPNGTLVIPSRRGQPSMGVYEITEVE